MKKSVPSKRTEKSEPEKKFKRKEVIKKTISSDDFFDAMMTGIRKESKTVIVPKDQDDTLVEVSDWIAMPQEIRGLLGGIPGLPCGLVTMLQGPTDSGKTTFANEAIRSTISSGGFVLFLKTEQKYSLKRAVAQGIDVSRMAIDVPKTIEGVGDMIEAHCKRVLASGKVGKTLVVWDSLAATPCDAETQSDRKNFSMDAAKALRGMFRRIQNIIKEANVCVLIVNQVYDNMAMFGEKTTAYGGRAVPYISSIILKFSKLGRIRPPGKSAKAGDDFCGSNTQIEVVKNHLGQPFKKIEMEIDWRGFVINRKPEYAPKEFVENERDAELHEEEEDGAEISD